MTRRAVALVLTAAPPAAVERRDGTRGRIAAIGGNVPAGYRTRIAGDGTNP
jgi:hypothetical protein